MKQELQEILEYFWDKWYRSPCPYTLEIRRIDRGYHKPAKRLIVIPEWAIENIYFAYSYIIHETCHIRQGHYHDKNFKQQETKMLKEFGLAPIYSRAYVKELRNSNGQVLWKRGYY